jgi:sialate O-acetylesterase
MWAQSLKIEGGVVDDQVVQRGPDGRADLVLAGVTSGAESQGVEARLLSRGIPQPELDWRRIATVQSGKWSGKLSHVSAGGPYRIEVRIAGTAASDRLSGILVGDIWLLAGQSDMEGRGYLTEAIPPLPAVHSFDMRDHWLVAEEPLHTRVDAKDRAYWFENELKQPEPFSGEKLREYLATRDRGTGLGLPFAVEMVRRTGVPIGLVPCALGGTNMDQWSPALKDRGSDVLYGALLRRARAVGGRVKGVLWSQGQSDAYPERSPAFAAKFTNFVAALREDLAAPELPFYFVQIGRLVTDEDIGGHWNLIQESQRKAEQTIAHSGMVATVDESLIDLAHADATSLKRLGVRLANVVCHDLFPEASECSRIEKGPRPVSAVFLDELPKSPLQYMPKSVRVTFASVNGRLQAAGRMAGFSIHQGAGGPLPVIYLIEPDPTDRQALLIRLTGPLPKGAVLRYGYGLDPYCNIVDEANMPVPAFGPMEIR